MIAKKPWGQPLEVPALEFPETNVMMKDNPHFALLVDVYLRLEQTPRSKAIAVPFDTDRDARRALTAEARAEHLHAGQEAIIQAAKAAGYEYRVSAESGMTFEKEATA